MPVFIIYDKGLRLDWKGEEVALQTGDRRQRTEDGGWRTEGGGRGIRDGGRRMENGGLRSIAPFQVMNRPVETGASMITPGHSQPGADFDASPRTGWRANGDF